MMNSSKLDSIAGRTSEMGKILHLPPLAGAIS